MFIVDTRVPGRPLQVSYYSYMAQSQLGPITS